MPRLRRYVSTRVREIGCDMANSRRAASGDPVGALGVRDRGRSGSGSGCGRLRKRTRLVGDVLEVDQAAAFPDHVEQVAMLAGGGVGPFAGRPFRRLLEPDEHGAARRVAHVAHQPVAAFAPSGGEVVAAHRLGVARETVGQFGRVVAAPSRGLPLADALEPDSGPSTFASTPAPVASVGTNMRSFQEMISLKRP